MNRFRTGCLVGLVMLGLTANAQGADYYVANGKKIELIRSPYLLAFETKEGSHGGFESRTKEKFASAVTFVGRGIKVLEDHRVVLVRVSPTMPAGALSDPLSKDPAVQVAIPVFSTGEFDLVLINEFIVQFRDVASEQNAKEFLKAAGANMLDVKTKVPNRYVVTFPNLPLTEALARVNEFNDKSIVAFAEPNFVQITSRMSQKQKPTGDAERRAATHNSVEGRPEATR